MKNANQKLVRETSQAIVCANVKLETINAHKTTVLSVFYFLLNNFEKTIFLLPLQSNDTEAPKQ